MYGNVISTVDLMVMSTSAILLEEPTIVKDLLRDAERLKHHLFFRGAKNPFVFGFKNMEDMEVPFQACTDQRNLKVNSICDV